MTEDEEFEKRLEAIEPELPFYASLQNKVIGYYLAHRPGRGGYGYLERVAIYVDKKKAIKEATAQIIWPSEISGRLQAEFCYNVYTQNK
jgi:hypothetical protein